jgi:hypothetical protein
MRRCNVVILYTNTKDVGIVTWRWSVGTETCSERITGIKVKIVGCDWGVICVYIHCVYYRVISNHFYKSSLKRLPLHVSVSIAIIKCQHSSCAETAVLIWSCAVPCAYWCIRQWWADVLVFPVCLPLLSSVLTGKLFWKYLKFGYNLFLPCPQWVITFNLVD